MPDTQDIPVVFAHEVPLVQQDANDKVVRRLAELETILDDSGRLGVLRNARCARSGEGEFPARTLTHPKTFVLEIGADGFNGYVINAVGQVELFVASSSMSSFTRMMGDMVKLGNGNAAKFEYVPEPDKVSG